MLKHKTALMFLLFFAIGLAISMLLAQAAPPNTKNSSLPGILTGEHLRNKHYKRVVCMAPSAAESVFALGAGDRIVGLCSFCNYPPEAAQKKQLGGFFNPDFEKMLSLNPDLVIIQGRSEKVADFCLQQKIPLLRIQMSDIRNILADLRKLGIVLHCRDRAEKLCESIRTDLKKIHSKVAHLDRPRVFFALPRIGGSLIGLSTVGKNTFLSELIHSAGGANIFNDLEQDYPKISKETLLKRQPEIIIEPHPDSNLSEKQKNQRLEDWQLIGDMPAVRKKQIFFLPEDRLLKPGPRVAQAAILLARSIHPEIFDEQFDDEN